MNIAFCTCVKLGLSCIEEVHNFGGEFDLFITLKDDISKKKSGRIYLDEVAKKNNTPLLKINHINDNEVLKNLKKYDIDWLFIIGWSQIASERVINTCNTGTIGAHPTLLPEGRGRAAIPWTIIKGLNKTGLTFFKMDKGVDTGNILDQIDIPVLENETASTLYEKVNIAHIDLMRQIWPHILNNSLEEKKQDESKATYWEGRKPKDGEINPSNMTVQEIDRLVRATTKPYPGAFLIQNDKKIIIWKGEKDSKKRGIKIQCKDGVFIGTETEVLIL